MSKYPSIPLAEIAEQGQYGLNAAAMKEGKGIRFIRITDIDDYGELRNEGVAYVSKQTDRLDKYLLSNDDLLIARSGATAGKSLLFRGINESAVFAGYLIRFKLNRQIVLPDFIYFYLKSPEYWNYIRSTQRVAAQPNINAKELGAIKIPLPPLAEQRRIVDILSHAEGIVRLRREAQKKAAEIIPALFLDMFGDPATNPKGWPVVPFSKFGDCRLGKMLDKKKQSGQFKKPYLRNVNVQWDRIDTYDLLEIDFRPDEQNTLRLKNGDVLICEGREIGRAAIWNSQIEECYYQKALHRLRPDTTIICADFVVWLLWHLAQSGAFTGTKTRATIAHLTGVQLKNFQVICPSMTIQVEFERRVAECHSILSQQSAATQKAEATFDALLENTFRKRPHEN